MSGLVALGDSITNGHGEPALGVHPQSWAQWLAEALDAPFLKLATDGATAADVLAEQVPRLRAAAGAADTPAAGRTAAPRFALACVYVGVNDTRGLDWDPAAYERDLRAIVAAAGRARRAGAPLHAAARPRPPARGAQAGAGERHRARGRGRGSAAARSSSTSTTSPARRCCSPTRSTPPRSASSRSPPAPRPRCAPTGVHVPRDPRDLADVHDSRRAAARHRARLAVLLARDLRRRAVERVLGVR